MQSPSPQQSTSKLNPIDRSTSGTYAPFTKSSTSTAQTIVKVVLDEYDTDINIEEKDENLLKSTINEKKSAQSPITTSENLVDLKHKKQTSKDLNRTFMLFDESYDPSVTPPSTDNKTRSTSVDPIEDAWEWIGRGPLDPMATRSANINTTSSPGEIFANRSILYTCTLISF